MAFSNKKFELSPRLKLGVGRGYSQNQILKLAAIACLVLALVLAGNAVRLLFKQSPSGPQSQVLGASTTKQPAAADAIQFTTYTVQNGDTLFNISQKFGIDWSTLAALNNLQTPFTLKPGQVLQVPK